MSGHYVKYLYSRVLLFIASKYFSLVGSLTVPLPVVIGTQGFNLGLSLRVFCLSKNYRCFKSRGWFEPASACFLSLQAFCTKGGRNLRGGLFPWRESVLPQFSTLPSPSALGLREFLAPRCCIFGPLSATRRGPRASMHRIFKRPGVS